MSKTIKYWQLCLMAILAMAFSACTEEYEYDPTTDTATTGAYMETTNTSIILTEDEAQQFSFIVSRHDSTTATTYKLYTDNDKVEIPETVSFAAGEKSKTITASLNVPLGTVQKKIVIGIDSADTYTYGAHSLTFIVSRVKKISDCQMIAIGGLFGNSIVPWNMDVYEYGKVVENGAVVSTSYFVKDPYASDDIGLPEDCIGKGNQFTFTLTPDGKATMGSGTNSLFYCSASFMQDASAVGDLIISGTGTYYASPVDLAEGFTASNFVLFNWESRIGTTDYGYGTLTHAVRFPEGYDPLTQTSK